MESTRQAVQAVCVMLTISSITTAGHSQIATFHGMGDLTGGIRQSAALDISRDGRVVVGDSSSWDVYYGESVRWTAEYGIQALGILPGHTQSAGFGVSADGSWIVGESIASPQYGEAFAWFEGTGAFGLGHLAGGDTRSAAYGASGDGSVVVGASSSGSSYNRGSEAFRWTSAGGMTGLGFLGGPKLSSAAYDISDDGRTVVGASSSAQGPQAFRWMPDEGMIGLGALDDSVFGSGAYAVSADGAWVAGESSISAQGQRYVEAVRWNATGEIEGLGWFGVDAGDRYSVASDIADDGSVVVGRAYAQQSQWRGEQAFIWTAEAGMRPVADILLDYGIDVDAMGWTLTSATGVSSDGRTIVGLGTVESNGDFYSEGWIVHITIPAPGSLTVLCGLSLLLGRSRPGDPAIRSRSRAP